ncbi:MAG: 2-oxo-hepta-3-ene-1,7-dioic acid hydratase [Pseudomonadales bacterium]|nr:2-oxo-hepta-3-ene-1,7-dioic acid hydratase [Pseudomonadales bacterium]
MLTADQIRNAAEALEAAERERHQIRPVSADFPDMTMADSYAIQDAWMGLKYAAGESLRGRKIGLTSRAMQVAMKIDEPDYGTLTDSMLFDDGASLEAARFTDPRIEVELAFVLNTRLQGDRLTPWEVLKATDFVVPALELIAARSFRVDPQSGRTRTVLDTIADNAAAAGVILGGRPIRPMDVDLRRVSALLYRNGVIEETGVAAGVLNHPANGIVWLARRLAAHDIGLEAGQVILAGSFTRPVAILPGDTFHADYGELGAISCHFD